MDLDFLKKKKGYHSGQKKYFGTIPRSEFYGFVLGYAIGLFVTGFLRLQSQYQEIIFALVGLAIGYVYDMKYCQVKDGPEPAAEPAAGEPAAGEPAEEEPAAGEPAEPGAPGQGGPAEAAGMDAEASPKNPQDA